MMILWYTLQKGGHGKNTFFLLFLCVDFNHMTVVIVDDTLLCLIFRVCIIINSDLLVAVWHIYYP
jgi:hypothetical protein